MPIPLPCTHLRFISEEGNRHEVKGEAVEIEVLRCDTDGAVIFPHQRLLRAHAGHHMKQPVLLSAAEEAAVVALWQELAHGDQ